MNDFPRASQEVVVVTDQRTEPRPLATPASQDRRR
jgi:hypothetical protein